MLRELNIESELYNDHDLSDWAMRHVLIEELVSNALHYGGRRAIENRWSEVGVVWVWVCGDHKILSESWLLWCRPPCHPSCMCTCRTCHPSCVCTCRCRPARNGCEFRAAQRMPFGVELVGSPKRGVLFKEVRGKNGTEHPGR